MKSHDYFKAVVQIVAVTLVLAACGPQPSKSVLFPFALPTPYPSRQIISNDFDWHELWRQHLKSSAGHVPLGAVVKERVILPIDTGSTGMLVALDSHTGQVIWNQEFVSPYRGDGAEAYSILADDEQVYLATPYVIQAYSVENGKPRWTSTELPSHTSYDLATSSRPNVIRVSGSDDYYVDKKDGKIMPAEQSDDVPRTTGEESWHVYDQAIRSNLIIFNGKVYAITSDVALTAYDPETGRKIGQMKFSGGPFDMNAGNLYWLLAANTEILVHFGDSQELIAFNPKQ